MNEAPVSYRLQIASVGLILLLSMLLSGFTLRLKVKPLLLADETYFISSGPVEVFYRAGNLVSVARTASREWTVSSPHIARERWHQV